MNQGETITCARALLACNPALPRVNKSKEWRKPFPPLEGPSAPSSATYLTRPQRRPRVLSGRRYVSTARNRLRDYIHVSVQAMIVPTPPSKEIRRQAERLEAKKRKGCKPGKTPWRPSRRRPPTSPPRPSPAWRRPRPPSRRRLDIYTTCSFA